MSKNNGFFGGLKGMIVRDSSPESVDAGKDSKKVESPNATTSALKPTGGIPAPMTIQGVVDNKFIDVLEGVIESNKEKGQSYFDFKQAIEKMSSIAMDEKTKFQTIFAVQSINGTTKEKILASIDAYTAIIEKEKTNFDSELKQTYATKVQTKLDEVDNAKKEMETLTKKLTELNNLILSSSQEAQAEEMKIRATEANFKASAETIINEMNSDKTKVSTYIA
jgi:hypothetical protein